MSFKLLTNKQILSCFFIIFFCWSINCVTVNASNYDQTPPTVDSVKVIQSIQYAPCEFDVQLNNIVEDGSGIIMLGVMFDGFDAEGNFVKDAQAVNGYTMDPLFSTNTLLLKGGPYRGAPTATYYIASISLADYEGNFTTYKSPYTSQTMNGEKKQPPSTEYPLTSDDGKVCMANGSITIYSEDTYDINIALNNPNIGNQLRSMEDGKIANIYSTSQSTTVPKSAFDAIKGTNKKMNISLTSGVRWIFNGMDITKSTKDVDCRVHISTIQNDALGTNKKLMKITFAPNGILPGKATIKLKSDYLASLYNTDENFYLYYLDGEKLILETSDVKSSQSGGDYWCEYDITHNSTFLLSQDKLVYQKPYVKLNTTSLTMQVKQTSSALKVIDMLNSDSIQKWFSSKPSVVSIHKSTGKLKAKKSGTAYITVQLKSGVKTKCRVKVQKAPVKTKSISVSIYKLTLMKGQTFKKLGIIRKPITANDGKITFKSSKPKIVKVTSKGSIRALKKGRATITVKAGKKSKKIRVTVK